MSYFCSVSFDLKDGKSEDYTNIYKALSSIGLAHSLKASNGSTIVLPTTMVAGEFNGPSAVKVRDDLTAKIIKAFEDNKLKGEIFVVVGGDWVWSSRKV